MPKGEWLKNNPDKNPNPRKECPDVEKLKKLYNQDKKGSHFIAKEFGVTQRLVRIWMKRCGIVSRGYAEASSISRNGFKKEENHPCWKGDKVGYSSLHKWVKTRKTKPERCEWCGEIKPLDLANKVKYDRDLDHWEWLCRKCHMKQDGRTKTA